MLRGLCLTIETGKITSILGPSGCGKSVLLKHITGILKPDRGTVWVSQQDISRLRRREIRELRKRIGVLFQSSALFDSMDVGQNIGFGLRMHTKSSENEIRHKVEVCLALVGLPGVEDLMPDELSGGMRKRAALARAIAMDPEYILYDEPTTGLDPKMANIIGDLILHLQNQLNITSVVVSHDMALAQRISDHMALLYEGRIVSEGPPKEMERSEHEILRKFVQGEL